MNADQKRTWARISDQPASYYVQASDAEREIMRDWVRSVLLEREITVDFVKANGATRSMRCTLREDLGAKYPEQDADKITRKSNPDVCVVWDVTQQAWRSFRWDRMQKIEFQLG